VIVDSSAWIELLRDTGSPIDRALRAAIGDEREVVVPEVVVMELCSGSGSEAEADQLRRMLAHHEIVALAPLDDTERAAALQRACRRQGTAVRSMIDCLVAAVAIRLDQPVLHRDRDFEVLARHSPLQLVTP
jgi:predicted nucleic acid-binding protein